jgi:hypothetical protein
LVYSSALKTEAVRSSETSMDFYRTTWRYIPEDSTSLLQCNFSFYSLVLKVSFTATSLHQHLQSIYFFRLSYSRSLCLNNVHVIDLNISLSKSVSFPEYHSLDQNVQTRISCVKLYSVFTKCHSNFAAIGQNYYKSRTEGKQEFLHFSLSLIKDLFTNFLR